MRSWLMNLLKFNSIICLTFLVGILFISCKKESSKGNFTNREKPIIQILEPMEFVEFGSQFPVEIDFSDNAELTEIEVKIRQISGGKGEYFYHFDSLSFNSSHYLFQSKASDRTAYNDFEGTNLISVRCKDNVGNEVFSTHAFTVVDRTVPRIYTSKVEPEDIVLGLNGTISLFFEINDNRALLNSKVELWESDDSGLALKDFLTSSDSLYSHPTIRSFGDLVLGGFIKPNQNYIIRIVSEDVSGNIGTFFRRFKT